jgi:hypothetical protein
MTDEWMDIYLWSLDLRAGVKLWSIVLAQAVYLGRQD